MPERIIAPDSLAGEGDDPTIRPGRLEEFVGQVQVKESLKIAIDAAQKRGEPLDHILFSRPTGAWQDHACPYHRPRDGGGYPVHDRPGAGEARGYCRTPHPP